ncbi:hypothetical protein KSF81_05425 [Siccirubricoccus sp. G192]|nr:hypothetical protein [Siccirubricoccus sp. G192]MBV1796536.1 hypothetical protein [Siccirubricoccus sp. G192]
MARRGQGAMHHAPVDHVEQAPLVFERHLVRAAIDEGAGIVDPGVEAAELRNGLGRDRFDLRRVGDIGHLVRSPAALSTDLLGQTA